MSGTAKKVLISAICAALGAAAEFGYVTAVMKSSWPIDYCFFAVIPMVIISAAVSLKVWKEKRAKFKITVFILTMILNYALLCLFMLIWSIFVMPTDFR